MICAAIHLLLGLRPPDYGSGTRQALHPRFLELPGRLHLFPTAVTVGQRETKQLTGNCDGMMTRNSGLVAGKLHALATP